MRGFCCLIALAAILTIGATSAQAQRTTVRVNNPGFRNDSVIRVNNGRGFNAAAVNVNAINGFNAFNVHGRGFNAAAVNVNVGGFRGANVNFVPLAVAAPARFNTFGTRTVVTPAGIYEVDAFGNAFVRASQASFVPATAFGFNNGGFVPTGFNTFQSFSTGQGFCR